MRYYRVYYTADGCRRLERFFRKDGARVPCRYVRPLYFTASVELVELKDGDMMECSYRSYKLKSRQIRGRRTFFIYQEEK